MRTMQVGDHVTLACDSHSPRRVHAVIRVDHDGAWLRAEGETAWCIGATAEHQLVTDDQGALW